MKRNGLSKAIKLVLVGTLAGGLAACGGGGSGSSGSVGASGNAEGTSVGAVTGFGSVYVNGTRFATDGSVSSDDGIEREGQLEKGMVLKIKGGWDERGQGQADAVFYDDTLRGPLLRQPGMPLPAPDSWSCWGRWLCLTTRRYSAEPHRLSLRRRLPTIGFG